jgi:hypothetical protein
MELNYFCHFTGGFDVEWIEPWFFGQKDIKTNR